MTATCLTGCGQNKEVVGDSKEDVSTSVSSASSIEESVVEEKSLWNVGELPIVNEPVQVKKKKERRWIRENTALQQIVEQRVG